MTLLTHQEKQVIVFFNLYSGCRIRLKHYNQTHFYDDFSPLSKVEKDAFKKTAGLTYKPLDAIDKRGLERL